MSSAVISRFNHFQVIVNVKFFCSFDLPTQIFKYFIPLRHLSTTEISTALRPFYFSVHPDLFGKYPEQRVSLLTLSEFRNSMFIDSNSIANG